MLQKTLLAAILFVTLNYGQSYGQGCLTNSLIINTGYDPTLLTTVTPGSNGGIAVHDPKWMVPSVSAILATAITGMGGPYVASSPNADVVVTYGGGWASAASANWINCLNANFYATPGGTDSFGYFATFSRPFTLCNPDNVTFDFYMAADNLVSGISIDGNMVYTFPTTDIGTFTHFVIPATLGCGTHTLNIVVINWNNTYPNYYNYTGLCIFGTVSSTNNSIVSESAACTSYSCTAPPITGPAIVCLDSTIQLSDSLTGGTWSDPGYGSVAHVDPGTGAVTGLSVGTAIISYTTLCGYVATDTISVINCKHPCADSSNLVVTSTPMASGGCFYVVTANVSTVHSIVGYQWSGVGPVVIHHNHGPSDNDTFVVSPGSSAVITCTVYIVDSNFTDSTGPCCQVSMTQTVTCTDTTKKECCFDSTNTFLTYVSSPNPNGGCNFTVTAHESDQCKFVGYIWQSPGYNSGLVTWNPYTVSTGAGTSTWVTVTFVALNAAGDTCKVTRTINLSCDGNPTGCCFDSTNTNLTYIVFTTPAGSCLFTVTAHQLLLDGCQFVGYIWESPGYNSGLVTWNPYSPPPTPPMTGTWVTVTFIAINVNGDTCKVTRTLTLSCGGNTNPSGCCFDTANTFLTYTNTPDAAGRCHFTITAHEVTFPGCTFIGYIWQRLGFNSGLVAWSVYSPAPAPPMTSSVLTVTFIAINAAGDTCKFVRTLELDCNAAGHRPAPSVAGGISIFPNPTNDAVTVTSATDDINNIQVIDVNGKKVGDYSYEHTKTMEISLEKLPPGEYLFRVNNTTSKVVSKVK